MQGGEFDPIRELDRNHSAGFDTLIKQRAGEAIAKGLDLTLGNARAAVDERNPGGSLPRMPVKKVSNQFVGPEPCSDEGRRTLRIEPNEKPGHREERPFRSALARPGFSLIGLHPSLAQRA